ncbi:peptidylprolyl isomerase [Loktanella sp. IMCC34160]|uniref:peptidylprolyl isomerase n=1 Tax=Loktanella sp. IMCC34160 TaxID=2510646 RepID=UPI00101DC730|nr:peptidylprolyl isomerase [Loktanella sp. IMCC34160]RYG91372.1 peptidylprolyl isomerase [Loktanella sp. IMCC34160]
MLKSATILAAGLFAVTSTAVLAEDPTAQTVVATVNGTDITLGELIVARTQLPAQYQQLPADVLWEGLIDQMVQQQLLADQMQETPARVQIAIDVQLRSMLAGEIISDITDSAVTEEALQAAYEARFANAEPEYEFNASHILVETEEEAAAVIVRLNEGADFAETAREISTGPSGPNGGELGWFGPGMMVPEFEAAVVGLEVGAISEPVQTQFGWHVVKLNDSRIKEAPGLDQVRDELVAQIQQEAIDSALADLQESAEISLPEEGAFDPAILGNLDLLDE